MKAKIADKIYPTDLDSEQDWQVIAPLYLINQDLTKNLELDCTAPMPVPALCSIVRELGNLIKEK